MIANYITISRILLSMVLLFFKLDNIAFLILYTICGATDIIDGYVARKMKTGSEFGSRLDSFADLIFGLVIIKIIFPIVVSKMLYIIWVIVIGIIKLISVFIIRKKYKKIAIIHTYLNKATGLLIFLLVYFISLSNMEVAIYTVLIVATITSIEELFINMQSKKLDINKKCLLR